MLLLVFPLLFPLSMAVPSTPIYQYLSNLCPSDLVPVTGAKHVRTCDDLCPKSSACIDGICCTSAPTCRDPQFLFSSKFPCLPSTKQSCPSGMSCMASTRAGMSMCCARSLAPPLPPAPRGRGKGKGRGAKRQICPSSHPIPMADPRKGLLLCDDCSDGICVQFHRSDVKICCQSHERMCGEGGKVEMAGVVPVDCGVADCGRGYECTTSPSGQSVCCAMAVCSSGKRARGVCAGGCTESEECETLSGERWCCPREESSLCPDGSAGLPCSEDGKCPRGQECTSSVCCPVAEVVVPSKGRPPPRCRDGASPLTMEGEAVQCPEIDAPCPKSGFTCQSTGSSMHCCPVDEAAVEETTTSPPSPPAPLCPFSFSPARSILNDQIRSCVGFLDFSCPLGYSCMPSANTATFLCCAKKLAFF